MHARFTIDVDTRPLFTACYLRVAGDECAFIEAHTAHALPRLLAALERQGKRPEQVRWVIVTHAHLDHAAGAGVLLKACPNATLVAHPRAAKNLIDPAKLIKSAKLVYGVERFQELYGTIDPIPQERVLVLEDGGSVELGGATLTAHFTAGHANHHFVVHDPATATVFSGDTFGLIYPALQKHGRFAIPSTSPTQFNAAEARKSIDKVLSLGERFVCPTHFDAYEDKEAIGAQLRRFIDRADAWVEEAKGRGEHVEVLTARFADAWRKAIAEEAPRFGPAEWDALALDIELNAQGLAAVVPTN
jgi:glyoxylase-like metal-dependent hydrolase (beta-lactamase superfamily II)